MESIAIIGGSGPEGKGLGLRFAMAGYPIIIGSRDAARAKSTASDLLEIAPGLPIGGAGNEEAATSADWVMLSVPYEGLAATAESLRDACREKLVISVVAPLSFANGKAEAVSVPEGSAAEQIAEIMPESNVGSAFQNLSATDLLKPDKILEADVVVCADGRQDREALSALVGSIKDLRAIDGGPLSNSRYPEEITALLVNLNKIHKGHSTIKFVGI